jgi:malate permease and related proteins
MALYLFTPALIFSRLVANPVSLFDAGRIAIYGWVLCALMYVIGYACTRAMGMNRLDRYAVLLSVVLLNAANYGLPVVEFAVGPHAISYAAVFILAVNIVQSTVGVYLAAAGRRSPWQSLVSVFRIPLAYAFILAFIIRGLSIEIPVTLMRPLMLLGDAAIPVAMVILGIQLTKVKIGGAWKYLTAIVWMRLLISPVIGILLAMALGIHGDMRYALILEAGMPTAVNAGLLAAEFDTKPEFVTGAIMVTTLASAVTLSVIMALFGG